MVFRREALCVLLFLIVAGGVSAEPSPSKVSKAKWYYAETDNFTVVTDISKRRATGLVQNLEKFRALVALSNPNNASIHARPVKVYIVDNERNYKLLTSYKDNLANTGGFFRDTLNGNYAVMRYRNFSSLSTLFHEYTHYLAANTTDLNFPLWYNEGIATYLGQIEFHKNNVVLFGLLSRYRLETLARMNWWDVEKLFKQRSLDWSKRKKISQFYALSWFVVHYFRSDPSLSKQLQKYIHLTQLGTDPDQALQESMGIAFDELNKRIKRYFRQQKFQYTKITLKSPLAASEIELKKLERDEVAYQIGEYFLQAGNDRKRAEKYFDEALSNNPDHPGALTGKANLLMFRCKAGNCDEAIAQVTKAKELAPENTFAYTISGHINAKMMRAEGLADDQRLKWRNAAVRDYNKAINQGGVNLEALSAAGEMYVREGDWQRARMLFEHVYVNAPSNHRARTLMIRAHMANGESEEAEMIAEKIRNNNHFSEKGLERFEKWYRELVYVSNSAAKSSR